MKKIVSTTGGFKEALRESDKFFQKRGRYPSFG